MFLLQALQQTVDDIAIIILNVKGPDLLRLDEGNPRLKSKDRQEYEKSGLQCEPFSKATYFYPYEKNSDKFYSNTFLSSEVLADQHNRGIAFNYIYTYEKDRDNLDLLFSNIDDPNQTIESILSEIAENPDFDGLTWNEFVKEVGEYTQKGHTKKKEIPIASNLSRMTFFREFQEHQQRNIDDYETKSIILKAGRSMLLILPDWMNNCNILCLVTLLKLCMT
jgi:hypothetical protein